MGSGVVVALSGLLSNETRVKSTFLDVGCNRGLSSDVPR